MKLFLELIGTKGIVPNTLHKYPKATSEDGLMH